ncbi:hypothetical protein SAMN04487864_101196 [Succiniclasticum ruminis]|uniref:TIGR04255 family protein n=1 Tax=Succiniclasticum ruminis TaxID=40841 RepID=A0A1G6HSQ0_9FIRM|nr:hypothetical protein [Succiniclasticum ruminis]SDB96885.1 hypothetical protein SAMN04487864_101196 [Succiniclasticum ruminis]
MKYLRRQISVFGDFKEVNIENEKMAVLYNKFIEKKLMPTVVKEFDVYKQVLVDRPQFIALGETITMTIGINRFDVTCENDVLELQDFFNQVKDYIAVLSELFPFKAKRLSFITDVKLKDIENAGKELADKYINTDTVLSKEKLIGWEANSVCLADWQIDNNNNNRLERINLNVTIGLKRMQGIRIKRTKDSQEKPTVEVYHGLMIHEDLNTSGDNLVARFDLQNITEFIQLIGEKHNEILMHAGA